MKQTNSVRIFILDEDELVAMALKHEIEKGFSGRSISVSVFSSAEQCGSFLSKRPDIVVMSDSSNSVSVKSGKERSFLDQIRSTNDRAHVIILASHESVEVAVSSLHHGVHDYVVKNDLMFKKLRLSLIQCFTILELRRNMRKQVSLGLMAIVLVFIMFGVAVSLSAQVPPSFKLSEKIRSFRH